MSVEPTPQVSVVGWATDGPVDAHSGRLAPAFNALLPHGTAPSALLALHGWLADALIAATSNPEPHHVHLHFRVLRVARVTETSAEASPNPSGIVVVQDPDLVVEPDEHPHVTQRVASYALVTSARGVLLTAYSDRTNAAGTWGFPGGGIDPGESPEEAVHREVWEETGQHITVTGLLGLRTARWIGRAPTGRLEDYHAVRVVYRAHCADPTDPVIHDVDGTTAEARWVEPHKVAEMAFTKTWAEAWREWGRGSVHPEANAGDDARG